MANKHVDQSKGFLQSFAKGLALIRAFGADAPTMTVSEAAARTGLTRAGARRVLITLVELGYAELEGREFRLRPRILDLGFSYLSSLSAARIAQPIMEELVARVQEPCNLAVLDAVDVIYVARVAAKPFIREDLGIHIGRRFPAYATALGRVLLGGLPEQEFEAYLRNAELVALTPNTITAPEGLQAAVARDRKLGYSYVSQESGERCTLAVPVTDRSRIVAGLGIGWYAGVRNDAEARDRLLPELLRAAAEISTALQQVR
jgi:IclR family transcriptional regulator, pca regulon regulatory protein